MIRIDHGSPVVDGQIRYLSVSALQKYASCHRAYYYRYVMRLPDKEPGKGVIRGNLGHERLEKYYKEKINVLDSLEQMAFDRDLLPSNDTPGLISEAALADGKVPLTAHDIPILGYIDLIHTLEHTLIDFKFKSDPARYGAKPEDLINPEDPAGVQMLGYGTWFRRNALADLADNEVVVLRHVTFKTKGYPDAKATDANQVLGEIEAKWEKITENVPEMKRVVKLPNAMDVEPNYDACHAYGGCAWLDRCHDPASRLIASFKRVSRLPILVDSGKKEDYCNPKERKMGLMSKLISNKITSPAAETLSVTEPQVIQEPETLGILPPDAPLQTIEINPAAVAAVAATDSGEAPPKKQRGRPKKTNVETSDTVKETPLAATPLAEPSEDKPAVNRDAHVASESAEVAKGVIHIYVNCFPVGVACKSLIPYIEELNQSICEAMQLPTIDVRCVEVKPLAFGGWKGMIKEAVNKHLPDAASYNVTLRGDERLDVAVAALEGILPPGSIVKGSV